MDVCLFCLYVVLSCVGRGLCDGLIIRPEESYRGCNCMIAQTLWLRKTSAARKFLTEKKIFFDLYQRLKGQYKCNKRAQIIPTYQGVEMGQIPAVCYPWRLRTSLCISRSEHMFMFRKRSQSPDPGIKWYI
jgi:hypothetical protein